MSSLYANSTRLRLQTGCEVEAFVRSDAGGADRPQCLLLHGNPGSLSDWEHVVPLLSSKADVAAIDLPGFGKSPRSELTAESVRLDRLADHAVAALDALGWQRPVLLVGHSHGGGVAQVAAARYPKRVKGLVLVGTLGSPMHASYRLLSMPGASAVARLVARGMRLAALGSLNRAVLRRVMSDIYWPEPVSRATVDHQLSTLAAHPGILLSMVQVTLGRPCAKLLDSAAQIRCPTSFVHGREDALVPPRYAKSIHERIVNAGGSSEFHVVPGAGHMLIQYQGAELADVILRTIAEPR